MYNGFMLFIYYFLVFIGGLFVGSFLNLVSDRVVRKESILFGHSKCENCKTNLGPKDLIPLLSFIFIKGKCRYCKTKLSLYYPLAELLTGLSFAGIAYFLGVFTNSDATNIVKFVYLAVIVGTYIVLLLTDLKFRLIPDKVVYFAIITVLAFILVSNVYGLYSSYKVLSADTFGRYLIKAGFWHNELIYALRNIGILLASSFIIAFFFWFLVFITRGRGMGGGDIKLGFLIGLVNGFPYNFAAILLGFVLGSVVSLIFVALRKKSIKDTIPFGPFLISGSVIAFVWGEKIITWYFNLFRR